MLTRIAIDRMWLCDGDEDGDDDVRICYDDMKPRRRDVDDVKIS